MPPSVELSLAVVLPMRFPIASLERWGRENVHKRYLIHVAGHNLGLLMRLLIGAGTPKEAVARGWCLLVLLRTTDGAADGAILMVLLAHSAIPALIVVTMRLDRRPD